MTLDEYRREQAWIDELVREKLDAEEKAHREALRAKTLTELAASGTC